MTPTETTPTLDCRGKTISTYVIFDASEMLAGLDIGGRIELRTDPYPPIVADIETWCRARGHRLIERMESAQGYRFIIEKGETVRSNTSLAVVISTNKLEELLSPLGFALAAALEGMHVDLYFQGPGVQVLKRGFRPKLGGWGRPFSRWAAASMAASGHIAAQDKLRQLRSLGASLYLCGPSLDRFRVSQADLLFEGLPEVEYLTFMAVMARSDVQIFS